MLWQGATDMKGSVAALLPLQSIMKNSGKPPGSFHSDYGDEEGPPSTAREFWNG
jgi:acetylornithine deacetylase/succinyl-diaminopimelate desuccinylase-like protein